MMPVALLDVKAHHAVLDMCASPGSKTTQAIEAIYAQAAAGANGDWPSGFVVANELDAERSYVLSKRCAALRTAAASCVITCHRAQIFPGPAVFDRIICDVPCSGATCQGCMRACVPPSSCLAAASALRAKQHMCAAFCGCAHPCCLAGPCCLALAADHRHAAWGPHPIHLCRCRPSEGAASSLCALRW